MKDESENMVGASAFSAKTVPCKHEQTTLTEIFKPTAVEDGVDGYVCDICGEIGDVNGDGSLRRGLRRCGKTANTSREKVARGVILLPVTRCQNNE